MPGRCLEQGLAYDDGSISVSYFYHPLLLSTSAFICSALAVFTQAVSLLRNWNTTMALWLSAPVTDDKPCDVFWDGSEIFCLLRWPGHFGHCVSHPGEMDPQTLIQKLRLRWEGEGALWAAVFKVSDENCVGASGEKTWKTASAQGRDLEGSGASPGEKPVWTGIHCVL